MAQDDLKAVYREYIAVMWNGRDLSWDTALKYFDENTRDHSAPPGQGNGLQALLQTFQMIQAAFSDWHVDIELQVQEGDLLATRNRMSGTHTGGDFFGIPASGRSFLSTGIHILRFQNGRMVEHWGNSASMKSLPAATRWLSDGQCAAPTPAGSEADRPQADRLW